MLIEKENKREREREREKERERERADIKHSERALNINGSVRQIITFDFFYYFAALTFFPALIIVDFLLAGYFYWRQLKVRLVGQDDCQNESIR